MPEKIHHAVPAGKEEPRDSAEEEKATGWRRILWLAVAVFFGVYIFVPEWTDAFIPLYGIGLIDEAFAAIIVTTALAKLGVRIPILDALMRRKARKGKKKRED